mgnify:CR=1 FL=1
MILELFVKKKVEAQKQLNKGKIQQNIMYKSGILKSAKIKV